jgi:hypothetical protein
MCRRNGKEGLAEKEGIEENKKNRIKRFYFFVVAVIAVVCCRKESRYQSAAGQSYTSQRATQRMKITTIMKNQ